MFNITSYHFDELLKKGYSLDGIFLLTLLKDNIEIKELCDGSAKIQLLHQTLLRKGLITENNTITILGNDLLSFLQTENEVPIKKTKIKKESFDEWWKSYPGTDTFIHKDKEFSGTRSLRVKKDDCKAKFEKILAEGEYSVEEMIQALEYEVLQKKNNSVKDKTNKLSYMQNSHTYLNQRTFEPFIELIKEGHKMEEIKQVKSTIDI